jgi:hypothetical protein
VAAPAPASRVPALPAAGGVWGDGLVVDRLGMPLLSCHPRDVVALHGPRACDVGRAWHEACATRSGPEVDSVGRPSEGLRHGCIRPMQPHAGQAEHPDVPRLVRTGEDGTGQVVERRLTRLALIPLSCGGGLVSARCGDGGRAAVGTRHTRRPPELPDGVNALGLVDERQEVPHAVSGSRCWEVWGNQPEPWAIGGT